MSPISARRPKGCLLCSILLHGRSRYATIVSICVRALSRHSCCKACFAPLALAQLLRSEPVISWLFLPPLPFLPYVPRPSPPTCAGRAAATSNVISCWFLAPCAGAAAAKLRWTSFVPAFCIGVAALNCEWHLILFNFTSAAPELPVASYSLHAPPLATKPPLRSVSAILLFHCPAPLPLFPPSPPILPSLSLAGATPAELDCQLDWRKVLFPCLAGRRRSRQCLDGSRASEVATVLRWIVSASENRNLRC